jgi:host cell factor
MHDTSTGDPPAPPPPATIDLLSGTAYRLRVCALNAVGRSPWSEVASFKTCLPGFPGAPSSIKITKSAEGAAHLSWQPPQQGAATITEYSVFLAQQQPVVAATAGPNTMAFVRVYIGQVAECTIGAQTLSHAHIDYSSKAAIIFRIAARNDKVCST